MSRGSEISTDYLKMLGLLQNFLIMPNYDGITSKAMQYVLQFNQSSGKFRLLSGDISNDPWNLKKN